MASKIITIDLVTLSNYAVLIGLRSRSGSKGKSRSVTIRVAWPFGQGQSLLLVPSVVGYLLLGKS
ncbi:hypothetical protein BJP37_04220 [Moorena bouillonii PNG]|uniref:Uncharacterized protein n=1 Tax=Moorena bouillonii PNG TaxID=568701 RepID=A0A1U7MXE4_9CYAN|nr:hypothetical protein BJP37_04220 [Moorena bouillonii PNG]